MTTKTFETATLGGGCFWCTEAVFQQVRGVTIVESGYSGGAAANPTYKDICTGRTGHAEVVRLTYDPAIISYREILEMFFTIHDPTTLNRQGGDSGTQYRSVIYFHTPEQKEIAKTVMIEMQALWEKPIVTELTAAPFFYIAEEYHQNYYRQNPNQGYCAMVVAPKVSKARKAFASKLIP